jgi:hypothetical protein
LDSSEPVVTDGFVRRAQVGELLLQSGHGRFLRVIDLLDRCHSKLVFLGLDAGLFIRLDGGPGGRWRFSRQCAPRFRLLGIENSPIIIQFLAIYFN